MDAKSRQRQAGVLADCHARGARVILLAGKTDAVLPDPDDGADDADRKTAAFQRVALLDMRLEISDMPPGLDRHARSVRKTHVAQRLAHGAAGGAVARRIDVGFGERADIRPAAEKMSEMAFL